MARACWPLLALSALACGCSGNSLYPVSGRVVYADGEPVPIGEVLVRLDGPGDGPRASANGFIQPDGSFRLGTNKIGDGCPVGRYRCAVVAPAMPESGKPNFAPPNFDPKHASFETSGLEIVVEARNNTVELKLERARPKRP